MGIGGKVDLLVSLMDTIWTPRKTIYAFSIIFLNNVNSFKFIEIMYLNQRNYWFKGVI